MAPRKTTTTGPGTRLNRNYTVTFGLVAGTAGAQRIVFGAKGWVKGWMGAANTTPDNVDWTLRRSHNANFPIDDIAALARNLVGNGQRPFWLPKSEWLRVRDGSSINVQVLNLTAGVQRIDVTAIVSEDSLQPEPDQGEDR